MRKPSQKAALAVQTEILKSNPSLPVVANVPLPNSTTAVAPTALAIDSQRPLEERLAAMPKYNEVLGQLLVVQGDYGGNINVIIVLFTGKDAD
jgi:hypothetical protein